MLKYLPALIALCLAVTPAHAAGGDGDPCEPNIDALPLGDVGTCSDGWICHACDPGIFGEYECKCHDADDAPQPCAPYVCLSPLDACTTTAGMCWDGDVQSCYVCVSFSPIA